MAGIAHLLERNRAWSQGMVDANPDFFARLVERQAPAYFWIGCSDSRVPANQILGLPPGDVFVHRNIANIVVHTDLNCLSALQYAVDVLAVSDVIVCGHHGCSGVTAALEGTRHGLVDNWLRHVNDVAERRSGALAGLSGQERVDLLCELNVLEQVTNVCQTTVIEDAWERGQSVTVHGLVYSLRDGLLRDLGCSRGPATGSGRS